MESKNQTQYMADLEKNRKRFLFNLCLTSIILAMLILTLLNIFENNINEIINNVVIIAVMSAAIILRKAIKAERALYRVTFLLMCLMLFYSVGTGAGYGTAIYWTFIMPFLSFVFLGEKEGLIWVSSFLCVIFLILLAAPFLHSHDYGYAIKSRFTVIFTIITVMAYGLEISQNSTYRILRERSQALFDEKSALEKAMGQIKTLNGLIPICSHCKKIRNDQGYWQQVETYVKDHSEADFSHSVCPDCLERHYPLYKDKKEG